MRNGTDWYISADSIGNGTLSVLPYLADFYAFDPADNLLFDADNPGAAVSGSTLTNVTAIGLHMQHSNYDPTSGWVPYQFFKGLRATVSGVVPDMTSYAMWAEFHGLTGSDTNLTADLEPDGLDNLSEWALGGDPNLSDAASVLQSAVDGGVFVLNYKRRLNADDLGLDYTVGRDTDLVSTPEGWTTSGITETSGAIDEEFESVTNTVPTDVDGRFMRLKIDLD